MDYGINQPIALPPPTGPPPPPPPAWRQWWDYLFGSRARARGNQARHPRGGFAHARPLRPRYAPRRRVFGWPGLDMLAARAHPLAAGVGHRRGARRSRVARRLG